MYGKKVYIYIFMDIYGYLWIFFSIYQVKCIQLVVAKNWEVMSDNPYPIVITRVAQRCRVMTVAFRKIIRTCREKL